MTKDRPALPPGPARSPPEPVTGAKGAAKAVRVAREAAALRANLRKRKDQARVRAAEGEPPGSE